MILRQIHRALTRATWSCARSTFQGASFARGADYHTTRMALAGHNKWSKIKRTKAANDLARANQTSKITRMIIASVKAGGGDKDPSTNVYLAHALELARQHQMPKVTLQTALDKAFGTGKHAQQELIHGTYEGLFSNIALIIETLTDSPNRTFAELRHTFTKRGGALTPVQYLFQHRGRLVITPHNSNHSLTEVTDKLIECDIEDLGDVDPKENTVETFCTPNDLLKVKKQVEGHGYEVKEFETLWWPSDRLSVEEGREDDFGELLETLEGREDVVKVHHNAA
ncbi:transcriptional regulator TACO1-like protein [Gaertneriomyces semiglobifer]|nr:transcriptional regulator TACO1-like protein [Gaertneriomyces semiglobifer]